MKNLKEFKAEFKLACTDCWGDAMEAWFECAGQMNKRNLPIPANWKYRPAMGSDGTDKDSWWYGMFKTTKDKVLIEIGNFLFRYCQLLKHFGKDY